MTGDDDLRRRLRDVDPVRVGGTPTPQQSPTAHDILERAMRTADRNGTSTTTSPDDGPGLTRAGGSRWPALVAVAAAAVVAVGTGAALSGVLPDENGSPASTLALTAAPSDVMSSCIMFDVAVLADMPTALSGTVTSVDGTTATVDVDRWYRGGPADLVTVTTDQRGVALDGVELVAGEEYLITASEDGVVNGCGYSGPATPDLTAAFEEAFPG